MQTNTWLGTSIQSLKIYSSWNWARRLILRWARSICSSRGKVFVRSIIPKKSRKSVWMPTTNFQNQLSHIKSSIIPVCLKIFTWRSKLASLEFQTQRLMESGNWSRTQESWRMPRLLSRFSMKSKTWQNWCLISLSNSRCRWSPSTIQNHRAIISSSETQLPINSSSRIGSTQRVASN